MISDSLNATGLGALAETLVQYKLLRWGESVSKVGQHNAFDLIVFRENPVRIQVKSTLKPLDTSYQFKTGKGHRSKVVYDKNDYDILAVVALDIERVLFMPHLSQKSKRVHPREFTRENEIQSWIDLMDSK